MLSEENRLYLTGDHSQVEMVTKWRREVREAAAVVRRWKDQPSTSTRGGDNVERCRFCPRPARARKTTCKWHV
ncbi:hypothetical protein [Pendulispora albinea]|uniref:Uncharacterized protein n=1 Tax=Pendulispora albinea TaxID=2741071 RepID=A0ABZ2M2P0_9BACT